MATPDKNDLMTFVKEYMKNYDGETFAHQNWQFFKQVRRLVPGRRIEFLPIELAEVGTGDSIVGVIYYRLEYANETTFRMYTPSTRLLAPCLCGKCDLCGRGAYLSK